MNKTIQLTDRDLAGVSGGQRRVVMDEVTIIVVTKPIVITGHPKK